jgi:hypothetical protein
LGASSFRTKHGPYCCVIRKAVAHRTRAGPLLMRPTDKLAVGPRQRTYGVYRRSARRQDGATGTHETKGQGRLDAQASPAARRERRSASAGARPSSCGATSAAGGGGPTLGWTAVLPIEPDVQRARGLRESGSGALGPGWWATGHTETATGNCVRGGIDRATDAELVLPVASAPARARSPSHVLPALPCLRRP